MIEQLKNPVVRITALILVLAGLIIFTPQQADAGINRSGTNYDAEILNALFHYSGGDSGTEQPVEIDFTNLEDFEDYTVTVQRIDEDGDTTETLYTNTFDSGDNGEINFSYDFEDDFEEHGFPYQVRFDGERVMRGYVAEAPSDDFRSSGDYRGDFEAVGMGRVVYNSGEGLLHDDEGQAQVLTEHGDYMLLHYRLPIASSGSDPEEHEITIYDENNEETEMTISSEDIYNFQDDGDGDEDARRSFILVNTSGEELDFVDDRAYEISYTEDNPFLADIDRGVYTQELTDTVDNEDYPGESVWLVGDRDDTEWDLDAKRYSVREGNTIWWEAYRYTEEISDVYNEHIFLDIPRQENFGDELEDSYQERTSIRYRVDDAIDVGDEGSVDWSIEKTTDDGTVVDWENGISGSEYRFAIPQSDERAQYTIRSPQEIADALEDFLASFGLSDEAGQVFFVVIVMIGVSLALAYYGATLPVLAIANFGLIGLFAIIGFLPLWLIIGLVMLSIAGLLVSFKGRE